MILGIKFGHRRLGEFGVSDGVAAVGAGPAEVHSAAGSLTVRAPSLSGEALSAVTAFVDGAIASAQGWGQDRVGAGGGAGWFRRRWARWRQAALPNRWSVHPGSGAVQTAQR